MFYSNCDSPSTLPRTAVEHGPVGGPTHGRVHHPQHWGGAADERDVHGELAIALDELLGAIQGVHAPAVLVPLLCTARGGAECEGMGGEEATLYCVYAPSYFVHAV